MVVWEFAYVMFLFVKLGREVNTFSFINHFLLTSHSLMLELDVVEFVLEFRVLGARSRLKNTMTLLKMRFIRLRSDSSFGIT